MRDGQPSSTAFSTATMRGLHRLEDDRPWILDDPFALPLVGPGWRAIGDRVTAAPDRGATGRARAFVACRSRWTEDRLCDGAFDQYVILGAGLDSFAYRRPDLLRAGLRVFEVDHPASQSWKRRRAEDLALPSHEGHVFVAVDFEADDLTERLIERGFDAGRRAMFSWLGVSMYLSVSAIGSTLAMVRGTAPGSEIAWTYWPPPDHIDPADRPSRDGIAARAAEAGEPIVSLLAPEEAEALCVRCGLEVADHPDPVTLADRYLRGRADVAAVVSGERVLAARVAEQAG